MDGRAREANGEEEKMTKAGAEREKEGKEERCVCERRRGRNLGKTQAERRKVNPLGQVVMTGDALNRRDLLGGRENEGGGRKKGSSKFGVRRRRERWQRFETPDIKERGRTAVKEHREMTDGCHAARAGTLAGASRLAGTKAPMKDALLSFVLHLTGFHHFAGTTKKKKNTSS